MLGAALALGGTAATEGTVYSAERENKNPVAEKKVAKEREDTRSKEKKAATDLISRIRFRGNAKSEIAKRGLPDYVRRELTSYALNLKLGFPAGKVEGDVTPQDRARAAESLRRYLSPEEIGNNRGLQVLNNLIQENKK